jgi:ribonuclease BN (tRNA processing enzyme)
VARPGPEEAVTVYDRDGLKISAFLVNHDPVEPAYGYRIEYGGRAAVVTGDTARVPNMVRFSKGADVLVHEALSRDMMEMLASALDALGTLAQIGRGLNSLRISLRPTTSFTGEDDIILVGRWLQKEAPL